MAKISKISFIGDFTRLWNEEGIARAFEALGVQIQRLPEQNFVLDRDLEKIVQFNPDLVLFAKLKVLGREEFLSKLKVRKRYRTASWTFDLYFGLHREHHIDSDPIFKADYVFGPDGGHVERFKEKKINYITLRQGIAEEFCYVGEPDEKYDNEVVFVGSLSSQWSYRLALKHFLDKSYWRFRWFGERDTNEIRGHELNKLCRSAKIVIGDSFYSPYYWSNRIYETLGRGGFMIHPRIEGLNNDYAPYKHYVPYDFESWDKLKEKINYFLKNDKEREEIARAGFLHTKENHTLLHRCRELIGYCT